MLVLERKRRGDEEDRFTWFCEKCGSELHQSVKHVADYREDPVSRAYEEFYGSEANRTCAKCGHVTPNHMGDPRRAPKPPTLRARNESGPSASDLMDWQSEMDELRRREAFAEELGGPERVKRQHDGGRLTIRERITKLADPGSVPRDRQDRRAARSTTRTTTSSSSRRRTSCSAAREIDGRPVVIGGDDFTVRGGSADATIKGKHNQCERMAHDLRLPLIRIVEGSGGGGSVKTIETTGRANVPGVDGWEWVVNNMGTIPRVALGLGSVAGLGAAHLAAAHYSVMVKNLSALFVAGPPVVERLGQKLTKNELGGWEISLKAGSVDDAVDTEEEAFERARRFLSYMPSSIDDLPPRGPRTRRPDAGATRGSSRRSRTTRASRTRCGASWRPSSTRARSSRWRRSTAAR